MTGSALKQMGLYRVEASNTALVKLARAIGRELCGKYGSVTIDQIRQDARMVGIEPKSSACWGAVFHTDEWKCIGMEPSQVRENHGRFVRRWKYEGA